MLIHNVNITEIDGNLCLEFDLDNELQVEWLNIDEYRQFYYIERVDSNLKYHYNGKYCIQDIHDELDTILNDIEVNITK